MTSPMIDWQREQFAGPYEVFDIRAVAHLQESLGRPLTAEEFEPFVLGYRVFGEHKGFVPKTGTP